MLITIDGSDFSGKTTQVSLLKNELMKKYPNKIVVTREPGGVEISEKIRTFYMDNAENFTTPISELLIMLAARAEHLKQLILPAIKDKKIIICDRFIDSTFVYQGYLHGIIKTVKKFNKLLMTECTGSDFTPDLTIFLNISIKEICKRAESRDGITITKDNEFTFRKIISAYYDIADKNPERIKMVENKQDIDITHKEILHFVIEAIEKKFKNKEL